MIDLITSVVIDAPLPYTLTTRSDRSMPIRKRKLKMKEQGDKALESAVLDATSAKQMPVRAREPTPNQSETALEDEDAALLVVDNPVTPDLGLRAVKHAWATPANADPSRPPNDRPTTKDNRDTNAPTPLMALLKTLQSSRTARVPSPATVMPKPPPW